MVLTDRALVVDQEEALQQVEVAVTRVVAMVPRQVSVLSKTSLLRQSAPSLAASSPKVSSTIHIAVASNLQNSTLTTRCSWQRWK